MKIVVFGCGYVCARYLKENPEAVSRIVGFLDNDKNLQGRKLYGIAPVFLPEQISEISYDKLVICSSTSEESRSKIVQQLMQAGAKRECIVFFPEKRYEVDYFPRMQFFSNFAKHAREKGIGGNVAECGVWLGQTAAYLNRYFYDRKLYLFDTFEGFDAKDVNIQRSLEKDFNAKSLGRINEIIGTVDIVRSKMTYPENVEFVKGYFPESAVGVEDPFCLLHIDFTLYQPILAALHFFWNKITEGGMILLRDYYSTVLPGAKMALLGFELEIGYELIKAPIGDATSVVVFKK